MTDLKIGHIWLINSVNWPIRALSACEVVKKSLRKEKNDILHLCLMYMGKTHSKKMISMVANIDSDQTKICFCKSCISAKITQNSSSRLMSEITTKMGRVHMDLWGLSPNIFLERNRYM